jgi:NTE family protein
MISDSQRALVLQGGGSLGAYEAGACQAIYEKITKMDKEKGEGGKPFLNIVAGTSIGAINAAIIVSYVVENDTWKGSAERLNEFCRTIIIYFTPLTPVIDTRFFDLQNTRYRFNSGPLKRSLERFAKFPIATSFDDAKSSSPQPRLLLVSVDVAEGAAVTFDSYEKEDGSRKSEYGKYILRNGKEVAHKHIIRYNDGITSDHVIARASVPINYSYTTLEVESYNENTVNYEKNIRHFWDGGIMSNTPMTQLVTLHRLYWLKVKGLKDTVPRLATGIVNVHPIRQDTIPWDRDGIINRNSDITFSDRTERDQEALLLVWDARCCYDKKVRKRYVYKFN